MLINNQWLSGKETIEVINPYNQEIIGTIPKAARENVDATIKGA